MPENRLDYSQLDFERIRKTLVEAIPTLTNRWTDHNPSDLGMVLLELFAHVGDGLAEKIDVQAAESFLRTAQQRQSVIDHCALIGYRLKNPVPASTVLQLKTESLINNSVSIPKGTVFYADVYDSHGHREVPFVTVQSLLITRENQLINCDVIQGSHYTESFTATGSSEQSYILYHQDVAEGSIRMFINRDPWFHMNHFQDADPSTRGFRTETNGLNMSSIHFGNGRRGAVPPTGTPIEVTYLRTLGAAGNIAANQIRRSPTTLYVDGKPVTLTVNNPIPATGGANRESIETAKVRAPYSLQSLWKGVTKVDMEALALAFPGVAKAQVIDTNDCKVVRYFQVNMVIAPNGGGPPSPLLLAGLSEFLEERKTITQEIRLFEPAYIPVDVHVRTQTATGYSQAAVRNELETVVTEFFAFDRVTFGQTISVLNLRAALEKVAGVITATVLFPSEDRALKLGELATLGAVQIDLVEG